MTAGRLIAAFAAALLGCGTGEPGGEPVTPAPDAAEVPDTAVPADAPPPVGAEVDSLLTINEVMASNAVTLLDDQHLAGGWIELYNPTTLPVSLDGYTLTDDLGVPGKATFAPGLVLHAGGHLVVWLDGLTPRGAHVALALDKKGGALGLARADGSYIDRIAYGAQETDFSAAREPDGSGAWVIEWHASPGTPNPAGAGQPRGPDVAGDPPAAVPAAGDLTERIMGYDAMPALGLVVAPAAVAALLAEPRTYVKAQLVYDGRSYGPVGLRLKGGASFETFDLKPSLRINIDEYIDGAKFFGLKDLTLNNMHSDYSMMHERLAYLVAREAGVPAARSNHALLTVNGDFYGLYANVETMKKQMVERWFADNSGPLFEATDVDFEASYLPLYSLESGEDDRSLIAGLDEALTIESPDEAIDAAGAFVDMHELVRFMAMCAVIAQLDSFPYSDPGDDIHLYADPASGRLAFMPWGMDETFYSAEFDVKEVHSVLAKKCLASPACKQDWADQTWDILAVTERIGMEAERQRIIAQIAPWVALDTRKPYSDDQVAEFQMNLYWFLVDRRAGLGTMLPPRSESP